MTCGDTQVISPQPFRYLETIKSDSTQRQIMVIRTPLLSRDNRVRWHAKTNYGHPHTFSPSRDNQVRWHTETNYGHPHTFAIQRQSSPMAHGDKLWSSAHLCYPETIKFDSTRRQIMVTCTPLLSRDNQVR